MTDWAALSDALWQRCEGYCESCGMPLRLEQFARHHRLLRSHGGKDELANLVALHHYCHNVSPGSVHQEPTAAYRVGLLVRSAQDPAEIPLRLPDGSWALLGAVYTPCTPPEGGLLCL